MRFCALDFDDANHHHRKLRETRADLLCARLSALQAQVSLSGARAERARELTDKIANAIGHVERLMFYVQGDGC
jgi:hypothetical protein